MNYVILFIFAAVCLGVSIKLISTFFKNDKNEGPDTILGSGTGDKPAPKDYKK